MLKKSLLLFILFIFAQKSFSQYLEIGINAGSAFYKGDLSHNLFATIGEGKAVYGLFVRQSFSDKTALKGYFNHGNFSGRDKHAGEEDLKARDLSFQTTFNEFGLHFEYNIKGYQPDGMYQPFSPYVFIGVNGFTYNPQTRYNNDWVDLRPLQTEGKNYGKIALAIPFGGGVKFAINDHWNLGAELAIHPTSSDYLDDVSKNYISRDDLAANGGQIAADLGNKINAATGVKRGNDMKIDWYHTLQLSISYNFIDNGLIRSRRALRGKKGCKQAIF